MRIRFLNHSSFLVEKGPLRLLCDPWIEGRVFNQGWDLVSRTPFTYDDFETVTHIWFSHEHPDHFSPPNLSKIDPDVRRRITVLFQYTTDKRVADFCRKLQFGEVIELLPARWLQLGEGMEILCEHYGEGDSWALLRCGSHQILNTNDCGIRDPRKARALQRKVGVPDVLLTQFSYAFWVGNPEQEHLRRSYAEEKLRGLKFQCDLFEPKVVIPIASFFWFCHEENFYLNRGANRPRAVYDYVRAKTATTPVILYPGETYQFPRAHDSETSIARYEQDFNKTTQPANLVKGSLVEIATLKKEARTFTEALLQNFGILARLVRPARVFLKDHHRSYRLSLREGLVESDSSEENCDVALWSESLLFCLKFPFGIDTLGVNGRYRRPPKGHYRRFYNFFRFDQLKSRGIDVGVRYVMEMLIRKLLVRLGLYKV